MTSDPVGSIWYQVMLVFLDGDEVVRWYPISEECYMLWEAIEYAKERAAKGDVVRVARIKFEAWEGKVMK